MADKRRLYGDCVIAKTVSRSVAAKACKTSEAVLDAQTSFVTSEARGQEASSERESLDDNDDDVERNADLYIVHFLIIKSLSVIFQ